MSVFTRAFWAETAERAVKSAAQAVILVVSADQLNILTLDWPEVGGFAAGGALLSVLTSIVSSGVKTKGSPSLVTPVAGEHRRED